MEPVLRVAAEELVLGGKRAIGVVIDEIKVRAEGPVVRIETHDKWPAVAAIAVITAR